MKSKKYIICICKSQIYKIIHTIGKLIVLTNWIEQIYGFMVKKKVIR